MNTPINFRTATTFAFNAFLTSAILVSEHLLEDAPLVPRKSKQAGAVLVIVPARNEERNIRRSVSSLLEATENYERAAVLVVDDGSTDRTPELLRQLQENHLMGKRLHVLRLDEALPDDWMGKPRACWTGAQSELAQEAEWLLFVDADTQASPDLIGRLIAGAQEQQAELYSIFTHQELGSPAERLIMPHLFYVLGVGFDWRSVNDPKSELAIANGQCILIQRSTYEKVDGHRAVRMAIAEDQALAERVKKHGFRIFMADGREVMKVRMYTSLAEIFEGWSKNAYLGLGDRAWLLLVAVFFGLAGGVLPFLGVFFSLWQRRWKESLAWGVSLTILLRNRDRAMREFEVPRGYAFTVPIGALLCCGIAFSAWYKVVSGQGVTWKGRRYGQQSAD